ncbi:MAG: cation transporter [Gammaproteobacteria bacterium]|nr:cation transporter [Gammaproteobacteria bacterium]
MSVCCTGPCAGDKPPVDSRYRRILWIALAANLIMFVVELVGGLKADSVSLLADAVDFFGDAANYALSLFVLALAPAWRSRTALIKGLTMGGFGVFVLGKTVWSAAAGTVPEPVTMGAIGFLALLTNLAVAGLLFTYRNGDADMRSVWLCSRNDAIGNVAVMLAALGVLGTGTGWPDIVVATIMGTLALTAARMVIVHARSELNTNRLAVEET